MIVIFLVGKDGEDQQIVRQPIPLTVAAIEGEQRMQDFPHIYLT